MKRLTPVLKVLWADRKAEIAIIVALASLVEQIIKALN